MTLIILIKINKIKLNKNVFMVFLLKKKIKISHTNFIELNFKIYTIYIKSVNKLT
jgi:hypothetical protein